MGVLEDEREELLSGDVAADNGSTAAALVAEDGGGGQGSVAINKKSLMARAWKDFDTK